MKRIPTIITGSIVMIIILPIIIAPSEIEGSQLSLFERLFIGLLSIAFFVICTDGIGLIIWIPLSYGVGWLVFKIFGWDKGKVTEEEPIMKFLFGVPAGKKKIAQQPQPPKPRLQALTDRLNQELRNDPALSRNQQALFNYVRKAKKKGLTNEQISLNLQNNGWPADSINWLLNYVG